MKLTTISEISREMNISTRTLRYYEQIGLIESVKRDDYAYRTYDEAWSHACKGVRSECGETCDRPYKGNGLI